jgi:hypothetical protein
MIYDMLVRDAEQLVRQGLLKASDVRGSIRAGRVFAWYFLPKSDEHGLPESIVDLHPLHAVRLDLLTALCQHERQRARIQPLYQEHLESISPTPTAELDCHIRTPPTDRRRASSKLPPRRRLPIKGVRPLCFGPATTAEI